MASRLSFNNRITAKRITAKYPLVICVTNWLNCGRYFVLVPYIALSVTADSHRFGGQGRPTRIKFGMVWCYFARMSVSFSH